jgi:hypothetical protein
MPAPGGGASYGGGANAVLQFAIQQLGKPYKFGSAGMNSFDCSGLTLAAFATIGIKLPHKAALQQEMGYEVGLGGAQPGDLVFFEGGPTAITNGNGLFIGHMGIYVGNGMVLEAPRTGDNVRIRPIGNRAGKVVSVKRLTTPSTAPIIVPPSPWNGMHGGPQGGVPYVIPTGDQGAGLLGVTSMWPGGTPSNPAGMAVTGAELPAGVTTLNATQIAQVAYAAGFRGEDLSIMVAIAMGESGGNIRAHNPKGEDSRGLWQINVAAHGGRFGDPENLYDPMVNAQAAFALYQERGFRPWTVYTRGHYKDDLPEAQAAVSQAMANGSIAMPYSNPGGQQPMSMYDPWSGMPTQIQIDPGVLAQQLLGSSSIFLDHPEIGPLLKEFAAEVGNAGGQVTDAMQLRFESAIHQTGWWRETGPALRRWIALEADDPAAATAERNTIMSTVYDAATGMGIDLKAIEYAGKGNMAMHIAQQAAMFGWSQGELEDAIGAEILRDPILGEQVREGSAGRNIRAAATDYGVPISDTVLDQRARQVAAGTSSMADFQTYLIQQAKAIYGDLGGALDRGETVRQVADPYLQIASQMLGLDPSQLQLNDPKWMAALAYKDPATGKSRTLNFDEWQQRIRSDATYGYGKTDMAMDKAREFAMMLGQELGKVA